MSINPVAHQGGPSAITSFGRGTWSFFEFLQLREKCLRHLKLQLEALNTSGGQATLTHDPERSSGSESTTYVGPGLTDWLVDCPLNVIWLRAAPVMGRPVYPVVLDVLESAKVLAPTKLILAANAAIALVGRI